MDPFGLRTALAPWPRLERALDGVIELHLFDGGYAGLLLQEDGSANLCLSAARRRLKAAGQWPISALVDTTNYPTIGYGRPAPVYDSAKL